MRLSILLLFAASLYSQVNNGGIYNPGTAGATVVQTNQSNTYTAGTQNFSGAAHTIPTVTGLLSAIPATCTVGEQYFATNVFAQTNLYICTATNVWTQSIGSSATGNIILNLTASPGGNITSPGQHVIGIGYQACGGGTVGNIQPQFAVCIGGGAGQFLAGGTFGLTLLNYYAGRYLGNTSSDDVAIGVQNLASAVAVEGYNGIGDNGCNQCGQANYENYMGYGFNQHGIYTSSNVGLGHHGILQVNYGIDNVILGHATGYSPIGSATYPWSGNVLVGSYADTMAPPETTTVAVVATTGNVTIGQHTYKIGFVINGNFVGWEANAGGVTATNTAGSQQNLLSTIPAYSGPLTGCTNTLVARTTANTWATPTETWGQVGTGTGTCAGGTFTDNVSDASLSAMPQEPGALYLFGSGTELFYANADNAFAYQSNMGSMGTPAFPLKNFFWGQSAFSGIPTAFHQQVSGNSTANGAGAAHYIGGGAGNGSGAAGPICFETTPAGSSGTTLNPYSTVGCIDQYGFGIGMTAVYPLDATGAAAYTGRFFNTASSGISLYANFTGEGSSGAAIYGSVSGNASSAASAVLALNTAATGTLQYAVNGLVNGNSTNDIGVSGVAGGGSATNNKGVQGVANGSTSGIGYGGYFSATGAATNYGIYVAAGLSYFATQVATAAVLTASLPTCTSTTGTPWRGSVSDATAPTLGGALTGGGTSFANVHCSLTTGTYLVDGI